MDFTKEDLLYLARIAEQGERFDEMMEFVKMLLKDCFDLNSQERSLFSIAFKNAVSKRRNSLRIMDSFNIKDDKKNSLSKKIILNKFRTQIDTELKSICTDAIETIDSLLERITSSENLIFLIKMKADYYRYKCEYDKTETKHENIGKAEDFYKQAEEMASILNPANPIRLGLMLNFSVFYYEVMEVKDKACEMARKSFDEGISELEHIPESSYKESSMILQLFRDNLSLWT